MKTNSPFTIENGQKVWTGQEGDKYLVTGRTTDGKKFRSVYSTWRFANGINLYRGNKWLLRGGKRFLICSVYN